MSAQSLSALERANEIRLARAQVRRDLANLPYAESKAMCAGLIEDPPDYLDRMAISKLLTLCNRLGSSMTRRILVSQHIGEARTVGQLTDRQRHALAAELRGQEQERIAA